MFTQAGALVLLAAGGGSFRPALGAAILLGAGTALAYPTLIAAVADAVEPLARAREIGVYRFWRDSGLVAGALAAGIVADVLGHRSAIAVVAAVTAASGIWVARSRWNASSGIDEADRSYRQVRLERGRTSAYARAR